MRGRRVAAGRDAADAQDHRQGGACVGNGAGGTSRSCAVRTVSCVAGRGICVGTGGLSRILYAGVGSRDDGVRCSVRGDFAEAFINRRPL